MRVYTSEEILNMNIESVADLFSYGQFKYKLTEGELGWLKFVKNRYCIYDYINEYSEVNDDNNLILTLDQMELSLALDDDCKGFGKAVCLSEDSALQMLFFCGYCEIYNEESEEN